MKFKTWKYKSVNLNGNLHEATNHINKHHPEWDVVAMSFTGGGYTVVVYRTFKCYRTTDPMEG